MVGKNYAEIIIAMSENQKQPPEVFCKERKHLCRSLFFPVNFAKFLRTSFLQNISGQATASRKYLAYLAQFNFQNADIMKAA